MQLSLLLQRLRIGSDKARDACLALEQKSQPEQLN
jgi:hypothetical protein